MIKIVNLTDLQAVLLNDLLHLQMEGSTLKSLHVGVSPITNRIFCGSVLKDGRTWGANKTDVTGAACGAVAEHVIANQEPVTVTVNGVPKLKIIVELL
jgi:hypothetical protein